MSLIQIYNNNRSFMLEIYIVMYIQTMSHPTYDFGFNLSPSQNITSTMLLRVCSDLTRIFNECYNTKDYLFEPERITEGGILWANWPGKDSEGYKSMRIRFHHYPGVDENFGVEPVTLFSLPDFTGQRIVKCDKSRKLMSTFLKAFRSAPPWNMEEIELFEDALYANSMPPAKGIITWKRKFKKPKAVVKAVKQ